MFAIDPTAPIPTKSSKALNKGTHTECSCPNMVQQKDCSNYLKAAYQDVCTWQMFYFMCQYHNFKEPEGI